MKSVRCVWVAGIVLRICGFVHASTLNVLPLGDSITAGYAYYTLGPGYRENLLNDLSNSGISIQYQGVRASAASNDYGYSANLLGDGQNFNDGFVGFGSADILNNLDANTPSLYTTFSNAGGYWLTGGNGTGRPGMFPDIALLIIGNNDMGARGGAATIDPNDLAILNWFNTNRPLTHVIIAAPPPGNGATDLPQTELVNSYLNSIVPASFPQDRVADVYQTMLNGNHTVNLSRLSPDGLHPLPVGYIGIAEALYSAVASITPNTARLQVEVSTLNITGTTGQWTSQMDLKAHDLIDVAGDLTAITDQIKSGFASGTWAGNGLTASSAATDITHLMALGVMQNDDGTGNPAYPTFDGVGSTITDVLVKYTHDGDTNLDGSINTADYSAIDNGFANHLTGWTNGDFNYDGIINGSDYTLIDNSAASQAEVSSTALITAQIAMPASATSVPEPLSPSAALLMIGLLARRTRQIADA